MDVYQITKTLGHFKATMEYHRTKDILHVMSLLGHKNIRNTLVYAHLVKFENDEWICRVAKQGTEYVVCAHQPTHTQNCTNLQFNRQNRAGRLKQ